ncbi:MAG: type II toxin-antitoxin system VapC family toxin [Gemmatimonadota bacterium]
MARYTLDTNLYIAAARDRARAQELERFSTAYLPFLHLHAVVVQELLAGVPDRRRVRLVEESLIAPFERRGRVITPSFGAWKRAGLILAGLVRKKLMSPGGFRRSFLNDCVLAASCREEGITLITANQDDFRLICMVQPFDVVKAWPVQEA